MKYLFILLLTVTAFAFDYPIALFDSKPTTITDLSGEGNDGTVYSATMTDNGISFNGVDGYIDCGSSTDFNFKKTDPFTICTWVKTTKGGSAKVINNRLADNGNSYVGWFLGLNSGIVYGWIGFYNGGYKWNRCDSTIAINDGAWHFVVYRYTGVAGEQKIYIDGIDVTTGVINEPTAMNYTVPHPTLLGKDGTSSTYYKGKQDNVAIYSRAIAPSEITTLYNAGRHAPKDVISTNGLVLFYGFTPVLHTVNIFDSKPTTVTDLSAEGNDGVNHGATMTDDGMSFNGVNEYIVSKDIRPTELTISMWLYLTEDTVGECIGKYYNAGGFSYRIKRNGNQLEYHMNSIANSARIPIGDNTQKWIHVTVTYDKEYQRIYINNIEGTPLAKTVEIPYSANPVYLGRASLGYYLKCKEDNVAIYDRVITSDERAALVAAGRNASKDVISTNGLVLFYDFDVPERALTLQEKTYYYGDLAGWWKLQGNALDYSKNENDGTVYGAVSTGTNYYFDGNDSIKGDINVTFPYTFACWVRLNTLDNCCFMSMSDGVDTHYSSINFYNGNRIIARSFDTGGLKDSTNSYNTIDEWVYVVGVFKDASSRLVYVNGQPGVENTATTTYLGTGKYAIGVTADSTPVNYMKGYIKDVRIYDKALTAEEINKIYNATKQ